MTFISWIFLIFQNILAQISRRNIFSSRVVRHPKTKDIALRKLVFGRSHKYDGLVRDIVKVN